MTGLICVGLGAFPAIVEYGHLIRGTFYGLLGDLKEWPFAPTFIFVVKCPCIIRSKLVGYVSKGPPKDNEDAHAGRHINYPYYALNIILH